MSAETTLEKAFNAYLDLARAELRPQEVKQSNLRLFEVPRNRLRDLVEGIEMRPEFGELVRQTLVTSPHEGPGDPAASRSEEIKNFFRRSRCYISIYGGKRIGPKAIVQALLGEFQKEQIQVRYLVPLIFVGFPNEIITFKNFQIRRFSAEELDEILQTDVNKVFYGWRDVDASKIKGYWFIDLKRAESPSLINVDDKGRWVNAQEASYPEGLRVTEEFDAFHASDQEAIASVLDPLLLYDWDSLEDIPVMGARFFKPFILKTDDDLRNDPPFAPVIGTDAIQEGEEDPYFSVTDEELASFQSLVAQIDLILRRLKSARSEWHFLEVALLFFRRAFFSSSSVQELLDHITVIEALLGEDKPGLTSSLGRRLASVLQKEGEDVKKSFRSIYELRSTLVHGNEKLLDQRIKEDHLCEARNLARRTLVWFLHYLDHVVDKTSKNDRTEIGLPSREELLSVLDFKTEKSRDSIKHLLGLLPADFPRTSGWLDK